MNVCAKNAIRMEETGACGYIYPTIDQDKCIDCGLCVKTCPVNSPVALNTPLKAFAAISKDKDDLMSSSSGAASSVMANHILSNGGVVYGCVQENYCDIAHRRIDSQADAYRIKGSKYVQSNIGLIYREVKKDISEGRKVLFTGTPCQIAGLRNYLRKDYDNLYLIDLVCHGVPSQKLLREDVVRIISKNNIEAPNIKVTFRKKINNNIEYCLFPEYNNKTQQAYKYTTFLENNYITAFMSGITFRENCFSCPYAQPDRTSDITIADFWGLKKCCIPQDNGVSLMLATTKKGLSLINEIGSAVNIEERPIQEAIMGNGRLKSASKIPEKRSDFINKYAINHEEAYRIHLKKYKKTYLANKRKRQIKQLIYKNKTLSNILYKIYRIFK